jgi:hypothetical protein
MEDQVMTLIEEIEILFDFKCPSCELKFIQIHYARGVEDEIFVDVCCKSCGEKGFFLLIEGFSEGIDLVSTEFSWLTQSKWLQQDWDDWYFYKKRHLKPILSTKGGRLKSSPVIMLTMILGGWFFFFTEQIHVLDGIFENTQIRNTHIHEYAQKIKRLPCLSQAMKEKISNVPIRYTSERPYHQDRIQFGEAGIYWGEEQIKIHRSNFWFFGSPKKSLLIETLIHELRHRVSPALGHNNLFYELVERDTKCVLQKW